MDPENDYEDSALGDEEDVSGTRKASEEGLEGEEGEELEQDQGFPARLNIIIEKAGKGALNIEAVAQNGMIGIHNLHHYPDVALAQAKTAEKAHEAQNLYVGPPFENLDEDLQVLLERYLDERGVNTALAVFVPEYIELKEQNEYLRWLSSVKYFVE
jgi:complement component 1 Q subcomponent-binding protein